MRTCTTTTTSHLPVTEIYAYTTQLNAIHIAQNHVKHTKTRYPSHTTTHKRPSTPHQPEPTTPSPRNQPIISRPVLLTQPSTNTHEHPQIPQISDLRSQIPDPEPKGPQVPQPPHDLRPRPHPRPRPHHPLPQPSSRSSTARHSSRTPSALPPARPRATMSC